MTSKSSASIMHRQAEFLSRREHMIATAHVFHGKTEVDIPLEQITLFREDDGYYIWEVAEGHKRIMPISSIVCFDLVNAEP